jgi:DNA-binding transcriptional ArsR family regulator
MTLSELSLVRRAAQLLKTIGHPLRFAIVRALSDRSLTVTDLIDVTDAPQPTVSQQLAVLRKHGVVRCESEGTTRRYSLAVPVALLIDCATEGARRIAQKRNGSGC